MQKNVVAYGVPARIIRGIDLKRYDPNKTGGSGI